MQLMPGGQPGYQAQEIAGGHLAFNALMFGTPHPGTMQYMEEQRERVMTLSPMLNEAGQQFYARYQQAWQQHHSAEALRAARAALSKVDAVLQPNVIRSMWELAQFQNAAPIQQRFIMAQPDLRELYHQQRADGFSGSYVDHFPGDIGERHYDYRRVIDGILMDDEEHDWKCVSFVDDVLDGDTALDITQQGDLLNVFDFVKMFVQRGKEDPSSPSGGML